MTGHDMRLFVATADVARTLRVDRFRALPREEIARLYASVEVLALDGAPRGYTRLVTYTAIHHNHRWLIWGGPSAPATSKRSLVLPGDLSPAHRDTLFLDEPMTDAARRVVLGAIAGHDDLELRLAGLLRPEGSDDLLGLVHVAALRRPGAVTRHPAMDGASFVGVTELGQLRDELDDVSGVLVDHLVAL
jgi:hypothetical protein